MCIIDIKIVATDLSMSGVGFALGIMLVVLYVITITEFTRAYEQTEEGIIHLQTIPTDKNNVNDHVVKEQWVTAFNRLLSENLEVSDDN